MLIKHKNMFKNVKVKHIIRENLPNKLMYGSIETTDYGKIYAAYYLEGKTLYICRFQFALDKTIEMFVNNLQSLWPKTHLFKDDKFTKDIFVKFITEQREKQEVYVVLNGSEFQLKVWAALLKIPFGEERTYGEIAIMIGNPKAARAVGNAVSNNNIAIFVPCHRVRASTNDKHKYSAGSDLKKKILLNEQNRK